MCHSSVDVRHVRQPLTNLTFNSKQGNIDNMRHEDYSWKLFDGCITIYTFTLAKTPNQVVMGSLLIPPSIAPRFRPRDT